VHDAEGADDRTSPTRLVTGDADPAEQAAPPARVIYAAFSVALSLGIYLLGRRMMPAAFGLFGALLLAVGATSAHHQQLLFGYRYLVISLLALLAFSAWLRERRSRWTLLVPATSWSRPGTGTDP
jgi:hypothetical protein